MCVCVCVHVTGQRETEGYRFAGELLPPVSSTGRRRRPVVAATRGSGPGVPANATRRLAAADADAARHIVPRLSSGRAAAAAAAAALA